MNIRKCFLAASQAIGAESKILSFCIISLSLAAFLSPAKSHATTITIIPATDWTLTLNAKDISPASDAPGPPDGVLLRAEAKRAFGSDVDTGAAATISLGNKRADPLVIKASAKVTNDSTKMDGVVAKTSLNFSRIYQTEKPSSSGSFTVNMHGKVKGIEGELITQNPFFHPEASMSLSVIIEEVDAFGARLGRVIGFDDPVDIGEFLDNTLELVPDPDGVTDASQQGDTHTDPGKSQRTIKRNFNGVSPPYRKKTGETLFFLVEGLFEVSATIDVVDSLDTRKISLASFLDFVELDAPGSLLDADALLLRASRMIDLSTGVLTPEGMSGFAEANFFSTIDLTVDATDIPEPTTILLLGLGLAGLGYTRRRLH